MNYCKDCEHWPEKIHMEWCKVALRHAGKDGCAPACAVFSAKKRTCGKCVHPYWRDFDDFGVCYQRRDDNREWYIENRTVKACDNFKEEVTRKTCGGGTANRSM